MTMPDAITVLHISDMQFGKFHRFTEGKGGLPNPHDTLTARLIDDLKHFAEHNGVQPDQILCTGDRALFQKTRHTALELHAMIGIVVAW